LFTDVPIFDVKLVLQNIGYFKLV